MRQTYSVPVVFLQLLLVSGPETALAQNFNQLNSQQQLQQMMPPTQVQTPDFNVGGSSQPNAARASHTAHKTHKKPPKNQ
jgi:hypothetical protein